MDVVSVSPLRTGSLLWRAGPDEWMFTAVCKATYALEPGESSLATEQEDVNEREGFWDDDPGRSLYTPSDIVPYKPRADVVLVGHAFAGRGQAVRSLVVRLVVGGLDKSVAVHGDREGAPWTKMPLRYERAAGGAGTWNPVGIGPSSRPDAQGRPAVPNLQPADAADARRSQGFAPVGLGPIASSWPARQAKLGEGAPKWTEERMTEEPLGSDFDGEFFQAAPLDQQIGAIRGDEPIVLEHLNVDHPRLFTRLPGLRPRAFIDVPGSPVRELAMIADTLWIDTDRAVCTVTWRGRLALEGKSAQGRVVVAAEHKEHPPLTWAQVSALVHPPSRNSVTSLVPDDALAPRRRQQTVTSLFGRAPQFALPFVPTDRGWNSPAAAAPTAPPSPRASAEDRGTLSIDAPARQDAALPFTGSLMPGRLASLHASSVEPQVVSPPAHVDASLLPVAAPLPPPPPMVLPPPLLPGTGIEGVLAASNAAADAHPGEAVFADVPAARPAPLSDEHAIELIWFEPAFLQPIRQHPAWAAETRREKVAAPAGKSPAKQAAPDPGRAEELSRKIDVAAVLSKCEPLEYDALVDAALDTLNEGGGLLTPLVLAGGELAFPFDERELLKVLVGAAAPRAASDKALKDAVDRAEEAMKTPLFGSSAVAEQHADRVRDAWAAGNRVQRADPLDEHAARILLDQRRYQRRELLRSTWIRALLTPVGSDARVPAYLPAALANGLPLFARFEARLIAEALPRQDQYEEEPIALRVVALGRLVARKVAGRPRRGGSAAIQRPEERPLGSSAAPRGPGARG